jgi:alanyl-tRNA synthetase
VRRIEALTGPVAVELLRDHDNLLGEIATQLRTRPRELPGAVGALIEERKRLERALKSGAQAAGDGGTGPEVSALAAKAIDLEGTKVLAESVEVPGAKALLELADRVKGKLPEAVIVLGTVTEGRVHLVASVAPELIKRGLRAGELVKVAAEVVGGGGGGKDTMAQAGGRDPQKLPEALRSARGAIEAVLTS